MKKTTVLLLAAFLVGLSLLLYPTVSELYNAKHQSQAVEDYASAMAKLDDGETSRLWQAAQAYNAKLVSRGIGAFSLNDQERADYNGQLAMTEVMSYLEIPSIRMILPIYHGVEEAALQVGAGHFPGSSLPVGGESTHCVLTGHRGLPAARLFTDLDQLVEGDVFLLHTLNETLTYEVDQILIVEPEDLSALTIVPGEDLCTLVTCTPYGVNTQRLLVRGHRVDDLSEFALQQVTADGIQIEPVVAAPFAAIPIFLLLLLWVLRREKKLRAQEKGAGPNENQEVLK